MGQISTADMFKELLPVVWTDFFLPITSQFLHKINSVGQCSRFLISTGDISTFLIHSLETVIWSFRFIRGTMTPSFLRPSCWANVFDVSTLASPQRAFSQSAGNISHVYYFQSSPTLDSAVRKSGVPASTMILCGECRQLTLWQLASYH